MSDKSTEVAESPATAFQVPPTPAPAQFAAGLRQLALILGSALGALSLFPDAAAFLQHVASPEAASVLSVVGVIIATAWGQVATRRQAKKLTIAAAAAPDTVAVVKP